MRVGIASDHRGYKVKEKLKKYFVKKSIEFVDYGTDSEEMVDYPLFATSLCKGVLSKEVEYGILICGTGIGMSIAANKIKGIRCGKVSTVREAALTKEHNMANVIALSEYTENVEEIVDAFINTEYSNEERHIRRIEEIAQLEK